jgi:hypothetical protein
MDLHTWMSETGCNYPDAHAPYYIFKSTSLSST